jgi:RimJ/RimL family protein N-acetyltransferase
VPQQAPTIETDRLLLRAHGEEDFAPCSAMWADPIINRYTSGKPLTPEEVWAKMLRYRGLWPMLGYGYWALEEKSSGEFVGELGFADFKRDLQPALSDMPESGWSLVSRVHGRGYASEALKAAVAWGDVQFGTRRTCCVIDPANLASVKVAEKFGYREWRRTTYKTHDVMVYTREGRTL